MNRVWVMAAAGLCLAACGNGESAVETRDRSTGGVIPAAAAVAAPAAAAAPTLTANRQETVDAKVTRLFERNGADFGARTAAEYLERIESFTRSPPEDAERVERPNGDLLLYQASTNTFAVVSRDGVPKTMFKPRDGAAYWAEQKARAPTFGQRRAAEAE